VNIDQALAVIAEYLPATPDMGADADRLLAAGVVLADYVRRHRPTMPHRQRGRTVEHAVRVVQTGDDDAPTFTVASLCGGLAAEWLTEPPDVDQLGTFDPDDEHACKTCTRRLPAELRPPAPHRPPAVRRPVVIDGYLLDADVTGMTVLLYAPAGDPVGEYPTQADLVAVVEAARQHARHALKVEPHPADDLV
jgi:hypothetical protein